eukprot:3765330-Rhodomonas_salina.2
MESQKGTGEWNCKGQPQGERHVFKTSCPQANWVQQSSECARTSQHEDIFRLKISTFKTTSTSSSIRSLTPVVTNQVLHATRVPGYLYDEGGPRFRGLY